MIHNDEGYSIYEDEGYSIYEEEELDRVTRAIDERRDSAIAGYSCRPDGAASRVQRSGIVHGRGLDHVGVEKRVGGCVEAERHGQRPNDSQRDRWRTLEDAEREPDVSP